VHVSGDYHPDLWGSSAHDILAVIGDLTELHFDGVTWIPVPLPIAARHIWGTGPTDTYLAGNEVYHFDGHGWPPVPLPGTGWIRAFGGTSANDVWAGRGNGEILHYDGHAWSLSTQLPGYSIDGLYAAAEDDVWVASSSGLAHYDGSSWNTVTLASTVAWSAI